MNPDPDCYRSVVDQTLVFDPEEGQISSAVDITERLGIQYVERVIEIFHYGLVDSVTVLRPNGNVRCAIGFGPSDPPACIWMGPEDRFYLRRKRTNREKKNRSAVRLRFYWRGE